MESPHTSSEGNVTLCAHRFDTGDHILDLTAWNHARKGNAVSANFHDVTLAELVSMRDALTRHIKATRAYVNAVCSIDPSDA